MSQGLSREEVAARIKEGKVNTAPKTAKTTFASILKRNLFTIFNLVNVILAVMIIIVGSYRNLLFIFVALANIIIGVFNELRAKKIIEKLAIISEQKQTVIRDGKTELISSEEIVEGDLILFKLGSQIVVDAKVTEGAVEVNESFITGESENILKKPGDKLLSGSFVVAGSCEAVVTKVGADNFINKTSSAAKTIKPSTSKLFEIINNVIKKISYFLIPIGILLLLSRFKLANESPEIAVTSTVAALISMIPEGLVLLTSSVLALSAIRLSKKKVLVQDLYSIETLARVDAICLDKTGTITTGNMAVKEIIPAANHAEKDLTKALELIVNNLPADNATSKALKKQFKNDQAINDQAEKIPFSSDRKYSGVKLDGQEIIMGALEFMTKNKAYLGEAKNLHSKNRVISIMTKKGDKEDLLGFVILEDEIRKNAKKILNFFKENNVKTFIISGDSIDSVTGIAEKVEFENIKAVDLSILERPNFNELVNNYNIFTRVKPNEKRSLILALEKAGYTVAMTGDGVNDVLAMKEADCSIAIGDGTDAARKVSRLVLLDSDFSAVPEIIAEGRQTINNLERSATLFLSKTTYASILSVLFIFLPLTYPFTPIVMSFLNFICIGLPAFVLALEPNRERVKDQFVKNIKKFSIPTGVIIAISILIVAIISKVADLNHATSLTIATLATFIIDYALIYRISQPLNKLRIALLAIIAILMSLALIIPFVATFFGFY